MTAEGNKGDWLEHRRLVMSQLDSHAVSIRDIDEKLVAILNQVTELKIKQSVQFKIWSGVAAFGAAVTSGVLVKLLS